MTTRDLKAAIRALLASGQASQSELAEKAGVAQAIISRFANNPETGITFANACKLIAALKAGGFEGRKYRRGRPTAIASSADLKA